MARQIQSPGVEVREVDLSLRNANIGPTTILIPGFASKGPSSEPIAISSLSEYEQIYGLPTNSAERYFYHTVKAATYSPASILTYRLPYGEDAGLDTSNEYSALVYPVATYNTTLSAATTNLASSAANYFFGAPTHVKLTKNEYLSILDGTGFTWLSSSSATSFASVSSVGGAGLIILNKSQSSLNSRFEGYYIGATDNTNLNPATDFDCIGNVYAVNSAASFVTSYVEVPQTRLDFTLSAASTGINNSISEVVENLPSFDIATSEFDDTAIFGVFKLRQSVFSPDAIALGYVLSESYVASFDAHRQINNVNGGTPISFFIETADDTSKQILTLVNPYISNKNTTTWLDVSGTPTKKVRFLGTRLATPLAGETAPQYTTRVGAPSATVASFKTTFGGADKLFALSDFQTQDLSTKVIGNVPAKLQLLFDKVEDYDVYPITVVPEAGLGTVYANSFNPLTSGYFDDSVAYTAFNALTSQDIYRTQSPPQCLQDYLAVANEFVTFAAQTRKDLVYIADPITNIFIQSKNVKTLDQDGTNFSQNIYWPLRNQFATIDNSYTATYANVAKVADMASNCQVWVPFSGFAAAAYGNTDFNFQPWFAPAGFTRGKVDGIVDLAIYPRQKQRDQLYKISLNSVAFFPTDGFVIYGQKTLQSKPSAFDRVNVRRCFTTLEIQTRDTAKYFVFEPNTLYTRTQVANVLKPIFELAKNTSGLYDYLIICDERNNTPDVIDANELIIDIYLKPVRAAEFILCNFYATRTGVNFSEIVQ